MNIVRDGDDYEPQPVSRWRLRELLQHEKDNAALRAELDALRSSAPLSGTWQSMETCPTDRDVLGWFPYHATAEERGGVYVMRYTSDQDAKHPKPFWQASGWVWGLRDNRQKQPTLWHSLPVLPGVPGNEQE